ncbi:hypothetical protein BYT27DRAFT_7219124 [Phlegmacium glaucopus]|nr:hypothetical protein BYT27DRAFT_7219124 [Phlegmacium glaucopus]
MAVDTGGSTTADGSGDIEQDADNLVAEKMVDPFTMLVCGKTLGTALMVLMGVWFTTEVFVKYESEGIIPLAYPGGIRLNNIATSGLEAIILKNSRNMLSTGERPLTSRLNVITKDEIFPETMREVFTDLSKPYITPLIHPNLCVKGIHGSRGVRTGLDAEEPRAAAMAAIKSALIAGCIWASACGCNECEESGSKGGIAGVKFENSIPEYWMEFDRNGTTEWERTIASAYVLCYPKPSCPNFGVRTEQSGTGSCSNLEED